MQKLEALKLLVSTHASVQISGTAGSLYCEGETILGGYFEVCLDKYADELAVLRPLIIFIATIIAFFIIFKND